MKNDSVLLLDSNDNSFNIDNTNSSNRGFVEAIYTGGVIVLRPTDDQNKDVSTKDLLKLMR